MNWLEFKALDEFNGELPAPALNEDEEKSEVNDFMREFIDSKVLGSEDSEIEPLTEEDQIKFSEILKKPDAAEALID